MSSRNYPKISISNIPPQNSVVGDEYFDSANNILYKKLVSTSSVIWTPIISGFNPLVSSLIVKKDLGVTGNVHLGNQQYFDFSGDEQLVSLDPSPFNLGSWSLISSGELYTLVGDLVMWYWAHNTGVDVNGNFKPTGDSGSCTLWTFTESGFIKTYYCNPASAGVKPSGWILTSIQDVNANGSMIYNSTLPSTSNTTGALVVSGGVGIAGNLNAGSIQNTLLGNTYFGITPSTTGFSNLSPGVASFYANSSIGGFVNTHGDGISAGFRAYRYSNDAAGTSNALFKYRGTLASPLAVATGDQIGVINFQSYGGSANYITAVIGAYVENYIADNNQSGYLYFTTRPIGSGSVATERMRIDANGNLLIGNVNPSNTSNVYIAHTTKSTSNITGALVVSGGVGIAGNIYSGSLYITGTGNGITFTDGTLQTTAGSSVANTLYLTGGLNAANANIAYIQNNLNTANANIAYILAIGLSQNTNITVAGTTANNALPNTGTIISTNGISSLLITNTSTSTSSTTGALQVKGGVGISGNTYAGGIVFANNGLYAGNTFTPALGTYNDGIVVDYVQGTVGNGRISVGTNDVITFYTGGVGTAPVANIFGNSTISTANVFTNNLYAASGIGYPVVGSTGVVTQGTNRTTGVTLNRPSGQIVLFSQAMGAGSANTFVLTNSSISANDFLMLTQWSGSASGSIGNYVLSANTSAGQANVTIRANGGIAADVPVLQFVVIKASAT